MTELHNKYGAQGFEVLAFPCNQYGGQEPSSAPEVKKWAAEKFGSKFQIFDKIHVKGEDAHPVYRYFKAVFGVEPTWNFSDKFLIDQNGVPCQHFYKESWAQIEEAIQARLK